MKTKKLIGKIGDYLSASKRKQRDKRKAIRKVIKKIEERVARLESDLEGSSSGKKRKAIKKEVAVLRAQRKKGMKLLHA